MDGDDIRVIRRVISLDDSWDLGPDATSKQVDKYGDKEKGCSEGTLWGLKQIDCICSDEYCNSGSALQFSAFVLIAALAARYLF